MTAAHLVTKGAVYRHYKNGRRYVILGVARDANADEFALIDSINDHGFSVVGERWVVIYRDLNARLGDHDMYVRTYEHFFATLPDGTPRFTRADRV